MVLVGDEGKNQINKALDKNAFSYPPNKLTFTYNKTLFTSTKKQIYILVLIFAMFSSQQSKLFGYYCASNNNSKMFIQSNLILLKSVFPL